VRPLTPGHRSTFQTYSQRAGLVPFRERRLSLPLSKPFCRSRRAYPPPPPPPRTNSFCSSLVRDGKPMTMSFVERRYAAIKGASRALHHSNRPRRVPENAPGPSSPGPQRMSRAPPERPVAPLGNSQATPHAAACQAARRRLANPPPLPGSPAPLPRVGASSRTGRHPPPTGRRNVRIGGSKSCRNRRVEIGVQFILFRRPARKMNYTGIAPIFPACVTVREAEEVVRLPIKTPVTIRIIGRPTCSLDAPRANPGGDFRDRDTEVPQVTWFCV